MQIVEIINKIQYNIKCVIVQFDKRSETTMKRIKNITLAGHNGSGKTSLAEALLYKAGASDRLGKTTDGTTIMDFDPEEVTEGVYEITFSTTGREFKIHTTDYSEEGQEVGLTFFPEDIHVMPKVVF